CKQYDNFPLTF
nr:immunoglobulin light chain junction region [Macaca mulatta]